MGRLEGCLICIDTFARTFTLVFISSRFAADAESKSLPQTSYEISSLSIRGGSADIAPNVTKVRVLDLPSRIEDVSKQNILDNPGYLRES